jgi:hypothetical protein
MSWSEPRTAAQVGPIFLPASLIAKRSPLAGHNLLYINYLPFFFHSDSHTWLQPIPSVSFDDVIANAWLNFKSGSKRSKYNENAIQRRQRLRTPL